MSDLTSKRALIEEVQKYFVNNSIHKNDLAEVIAKLPTVEAKPVEWIPCSDYLHNALRFIEQGNADVAYDEICYAIIKSGGKLTESEEEYRKKVC